MNRDTYEVMAQLQRLGFTWEQAQQLRRISMTLRRWFELECGTNHGCIERDEESGKAYWCNAMTGDRYPARDRETGARKRLAVIMAPFKRRLIAFVQTDCRGCALYILRKSDVNAQARHSGKPASEVVDSMYTRGIAVY